MIKLIIAGVALLALVTGGALIKRRQEQIRFGDAEERGTLRWYAKEAKKRGKKAVSLPAPEIEYVGEADDPDFVLANYSLVIAEPVESKTLVPQPYSIVTWYKFRTLENIAPRPPLQGIPTVDPPGELLPLDDGEFLVARDEGSVLVDDVSVFVKDPDLPPFAKGKRYLLFISKHPSGFATLWAGPNGAFAVSPEAKIEPVSKRPHPINEALEKRFDNSVGQMKEKLVRN